jgi:hypothetical protein
LSLAKNCLSFSSIHDLTTFAIDPPFKRSTSSILDSHYADTTFCFICNPFPFKIFKINCNAFGCRCKSISLIGVLRYQTWSKALIL